jgi:hypothetical protein
VLGWGWGGCAGVGVGLCWGGDGVAVLGWGWGGCAGVGMGWLCDGLCFIFIPGAATHPRHRHLTEMCSHQLQ